MNGRSLYGVLESAGTFRSPRDGGLIDPGTLAARIRARTELPLTRKEFFCTPSQLDESVAAGRSDLCVLRFDLSDAGEAK